MNGLEQEQTDLRLGVTLDSSGLRRGVFLSLGVHALAVLILAGGLAGSNPPRPIKGFDSCLHVDLVSTARAPAHPTPHPAPPEAVRRIKPVPAPVPTPVAAPADHPRSESLRAAAVLASLARRLPFGHDGSSAGAGEDAATASGRTTPPPAAMSGPVGGKETGGAVTSLAVPRYHENPHPAYPRLARLRGHEGVVLLNVEVLPNGKVGRLKVKTSSGHDLLDQSALAGLKKWIFEPGRKLGIPVAMWVDVPIRFHLQ